jgi:hypothetical protein
MLDLFATALALDPVTADFLLTLVLSLLLVCGAGTSLALLPWSDDEIQDVDRGFRALWLLPAQRAAAHRAGPTVTG